MCGEIPTGCSRCLDALNDSIRVYNEFAGGQHVVDILCGLFNVAFNIHSETGRLRDCQPEVQSDCSRDTAKTDEQAPHEIDVVELCG